ncbi:MAG: PIN domain-containing protein [Symploca sp. SIO2E9]|nr:PIN domain-containing protein [Symploca sp. SIO2E9]
MRILISDTSCLIDLRKASLLEAFFQLPYDLVIPDVLFEQELVQFSNIEKELIAQELRIVSLPGEGVVRVQSVSRDYPALTLNDCFALVLAEQTPNCILMTGDRNLRNLATSSGIEVHGVLWGIDEMYSARVATANQLYSALLLFKADSTVRLPVYDLNRWIERYQSQ